MIGYRLFHIHYSISANFWIYLHLDITFIPAQTVLTSKQLVKPPPPLLRLLALLVRLGLPGEKLLLDCPRMKGLGRCLLGGGQRVNKPGDGLGLLLDLPDRFHTFKNQPTGHSPLKPGVDM